MMESLINDITDIFGGPEIARDDTGNLASVARLLEDCEPTLLLLAGADGKVIVADDFGADDLDAAGPLASDLAGRLAGSETCRFEAPTDAGPRLGFGVRLPDDSGGGILGGLVRRCELSERRLDELQSVLVTCGAFVRSADRGKANNARLNTRVRHLLAERDVLKTSHAEAVTASIEEREERLREQQEYTTRIEAVMRAADEGIMGLDQNGNVLFVNPTAMQMLGRRVEELIGKPEHEVFHHKKANGVPYPLEECPIHKTLREGKCHRVGDDVFWRRNGTSFPVEYGSRPIVEEGKIVGAVVTFRDTTERRLLERRLVQAQKLESIGQLAAGIAHEINTPMQYIGDNIRFLEEAFRDLRALLVECNRLRRAAEHRGVTEDVAAAVLAAAERADVEFLVEETPKAIEQSLEGLDRVAKIVRSMKDFSHPGGEQKQAVDLNRAIESTLTVSRNEWKYVADVVTEFDPHLPLVHCLPGELNQVILNLIINAAHAIAGKSGDVSTEKGPTEKGTITVRTRRDGDSVEIRVEDTGTGIPEEIRSSVFDPFFTTKEVGRGTGQGLAIAHSVVTDKHGGTITLESEVGRGTTFIIRLPLKVAGVERSEPPNRCISGGSLCSTPATQPPAGESVDGAGGETR
jgi:PAS domain S-box-containing protein